jgi:hypothetical protein
MLSKPLRPSANTGESWDPLHDCFPSFGVRDVHPAVGHNILCKLKTELEFTFRTAWNNAQILYEVENKSSSRVKSSSLSSKVNCTGSGNCSQSTGKRQRRFHTCSVVSNSGVLRNHHHGNAIDTSDMVLRFNDAPLNGWPHLAGTRDDTRIVNNQFPHRVLHGASRNYQLKAETMFGLLDDGSGFKSLQDFKYAHPNLPIRKLEKTLLDAFQGTLRSIYDAHWFYGSAVSFNPTTGAVGMIIAMTECDEVRAFGMAATPAADLAPYHYYAEDDPPSHLEADENTWHKTFRAEKDLWRRIAQNAASDIDNTEIAVIPGFSQLQCP